MIAQETVLLVDDEETIEWFAVSSAANLRSLPRGRRAGPGNTGEPERSCCYYQRYAHAGRNGVEVLEAFSKNPLPPPVSC